jgi:hypothetical protein
MGMTKRDMLLLRAEFPARPGLLPFGVVLYFQPARPSVSINEQLQDVLDGKGKFIVHDERHCDGENAGEIAYDNGSYFERPADDRAYANAYKEFRRRVDKHLADCDNDAKAEVNPIERILRYRGSR